MIKYRDFLKNFDTLIPIYEDPLYYVSFKTFFEFLKLGNENSFYLMQLLLYSVEETIIVFSLKRVSWFITFKKQAEQLRVGTTNCKKPNHYVLKLKNSPKNYFFIRPFSGSTKPCKGLSCTYSFPFWWSSQNWALFFTFFENGVFWSKNGQFWEDHFKGEGIC